MKTTNKARVSLLAALLTIFSLNTTNAATLGIESANNYAPGPLANGTVGTIGTWYVTTDGGGASVTIGDSSQGGRTSIGNSAFFLQPGITGWNQFSNAWFVLGGESLLTGQTVSVNANYLWNGGVRGVQFQTAGGTSLFRFEQRWGDNIQFKGTGLVDTDVVTSSMNAYQRALTYSVEQLSPTSVYVTASLLGDTSPLFAQTVNVPSEIAQIQFYAGDIQTSSADQVNFGMFVNDITVSGIPEPSTGLLIALGTGLLIMTRTISRKLA